MKPALEVVTELCDAKVDADAARRVPSWHWGPALFGFALAELDAHLGRRRNLGWLRRFADHYVAHPPAIDQSDTAAPGLITYPLWRETGDERYLALTERVVDYVRTEPRDVGGVVNHLGHSAVGRLYPRSAWVDSLMMFSVFPARYGHEQHQPDLVDLAARQPGAFARLLFDEPDGLWSHAWWARTGEPYPRRGIYWARGNGWVIASLPMILDRVGGHPERPAILRLLRRTSRTLLALQRSDGTWDTLLDPERRSYRELSATALIASGWLAGVRAGYLDRRYLEPARTALHAVVSSLRLVDGRWVMPEISGPTIPLPLLPWLGYRLVPRGEDHPYGLAALVFAAINDDRMR